MMFFKQIDEIIRGTKTQTRRIVKPGERLLYDDGDGEDMILTSSGRLKWMVGRDYAVQLGRGKPGVWVNFNHPCYEYDIWPDINVDEHKIANGQDYEPLRIRLMAIRQERLQDISETDAKAEGYPWSGTLGERHGFIINSRVWYRNLWDDINTRKGTRWADNPHVWVLSFEVANSVAQTGTT